MGKNKNKKGMKKKLFSTDYSDMTQEEQFELLLLGDKLMNGEDVSIEDFNANKEDVKPKYATGDTVLDILNYIKDQNFIPGENEDVSFYADQLEDDCVPVTVEHNDEEEPVKEQVPEEKPVPEKDDEEEDDDDEEDGYSELFDSEEENEDEIDMSTATMDDEFKVICGDHESGDIVIKDSWKEFKSHTISFFNMIQAKIDYSKSPLYEDMKTFIDLAIAFIAGPVLVVKHGNQKFKEFINSVKSFDRERIFVLSKFDDENVDENGDPLIHFLVYYIDSESKETLETIFDVFEEPESENNRIILDFMFSVFKKAVDRHENQWGNYDNIDTLIDEFESSDADMDFVLTLIKNDKDTELGQSNFDNFMDNFVLPIEMFLTTKYNSSNVFNVYVSLFEYIFDTERDDIVIDEDGVIIVPNNFGYDENGTHVESFEQVKNDHSGVTEVKEETTEVVITNDDSDIEESDGDDIDLPTPSMVVHTTEKKLSVPSKAEQPSNGIKKFGSKPHSGGPLVIKA